MHILYKNNYFFTQLNPVSNPCCYVLWLWVIINNRALKCLLDMLIYDDNAVATYDLDEKDPVLFNNDIYYIKKF